MIYVVRHGETDWNVEGRIQGQSETFLTPKGIKQAEELRDTLKGIAFDLAICSPLARAKDTCKIILGGDDLKVKYDSRLMERDFGEMTGVVDKFMSFWDSGKPREAKGLETIGEMEERIFPLMQEIVSEYSDKNVLIVAHQGPLFIIENFFGYAPADGNYMSHRLQGCGYRIYDPETKEKKEYGTSNTGLSG